MTMNRLTTNKEVSEMSMIELAYNSCYTKENKARYRDYDMDFDARELAIRLLEKVDIPNEFTSDENFDDFMLDAAEYGTDKMLGLIALFYRNLWAMADLRERLKEYEDLEEQGRMLIVPDIPKNKTLYWIWENEIIPVTYKRITSCVVADDGRPHIMCEMVTKKDRTYVQTYRRKLVEHTFKKGDKVYFYADNLGKTVFLTRAEATEALKGMKREE